METYLNCTRAGNKTSITLDLRACLCTVQCPIKVREKCKSFKAVSITKVETALEWIKNKYYSIPRSTYKGLHSQCKSGNKPSYCKKCNAVRLHLSQDCVGECTVCAATTTFQSITPVRNTQEQNHIPIVVKKVVVTHEEYLPQRPTVGRQ